MSEEKKQLMREADKKRKVKARGEKCFEGERQTNRPIYDEQEANRQYKRRVKESQTEEEKEFMTYRKEGGG